MKFLKIVPLFMLIALTACGGGKNADNGGGGNGGSGGSTLTYNEWRKKIDAAPSHSYSSVTIKRHYKSIDPWYGETEQDDDNSPWTLTAENGRFSGNDFAAVINLKGRWAADYSTEQTKTEIERSYSDIHVTVTPFYTASDKEFTAGYNATGTGTYSYEDDDCEITEFKASRLLRFNEYGYLIEDTTVHDFTFAASSGPIRNMLTTQDTFSYK